MTSKARNIADLGSNDVIETTATGVDVTGTVTADGLTVDGQGTFTTADNNAQVTLVSTDTDALVGPQLNLWRNSGTGTNGDLIGQITFTGEDTVGSTNTFASMYSVADQTNNGAEDGSLHFQTLINGVLEDRFEINDAGNSIFTGNVGLGTSSPATKLMLEHSNDGAVGGTIRIKDRDSQQVPGQLTGAIEFESEDATMPTSGVSTAIKAYCASTAGGSYLTLSTTDQYTSTLDERVRITDSGRVGIGTNSPASALHVRDSGNPTITVDGSDGAYTSFLTLKAAGAGASVIRAEGGTNSLVLQTNGDNERARIDSSGNLLVGTTSGVDKFNVYQASGGTIATLQSAGTTGAYAVAFKNPNGTVGNITISGTTTTYNTSSDERLKENIQDTTHTVNIDDIQVREFDWKADGSHQRYGFIAQELETVYPEAVHSPEDEDEMKSVDYSKLVPLLVKEIQTLKARIETLENN